MNLLVLLQDIFNWLLADPSHVVAFAAAIAALTPTPDPATLQGKLYKIIEIFALNVFRAKEQGIDQPTSVLKQQDQ